MSLFGEVEWCEVGVGENAFGQLLSPALMMTDWVVSVIGVCDVPDTLVRDITARPKCSF